MDLFDTRRLDPAPPGQQRGATPDRTLHQATAGTTVKNEAPDLMTPVHDTINIGLRNVYGSEWEAARSAIETAAGEGDRAAIYARVGTEPQAFGPVAGDFRFAERLGGALGVRDEIAATVGQPPGCPECRLEPLERLPVGVDNTVRFIRQHLEEDNGVPDTVDLCAIRMAMQHNPLYASSIVESLGSGDLARWMGHVENSVEWQTTFETLATSLDAERLLDVVEALPPSRGTQGDGPLGTATGLTSTDIPDRIAVQFAHVIASHAPEAVRADVVRTVLGDKGPNEALHNSHNLGVVACRALGSLVDNPDLLDWAVQNADAFDFQALLDAGTTRAVDLPISFGNGAVPVRTYDSEAAGWVLYGMSRVTDIGKRSAAFVAGARHLDRLNTERNAIGPGADIRPAVSEITKGLTHLLRTRTNDIVERLRTQEDGNGSALTSYLEALIDNESREGDAGGLGIGRMYGQLERLQRWRRSHRERARPAA